MPVSGQLTPDELRAALEPWMARQMPDASDVRVTDVVIPQSSGFSNETFLVDAAWTDDDGDQQVELVRAQPGAGPPGCFPSPTRCASSSRPCASSASTPTCRCRGCGGRSPTRR